MASPFRDVVFIDQQSPRERDSPDLDLTPYGPGNFPFNRDRKLDGKGRQPETSVELHASYNKYSFQTKKKPPAEHPRQYHTNESQRFELFLLGPGEKKVSWEHDTRVPNTAIFTFNKEDHTLGNLLAQRLHKYRYVNFSGYQVPHPLFASFKLRVSTDGTVSPKDAVINACRDVVQDLEVFSREFTKEMELKKIAKAGGEA
ncbi:DNA-directed RNA polymerase [Phyllosticta citricarpa]